MMLRLRPTQTIRSVLDLDLHSLHAAGKRVILFDLDNTLCRRGTKTLDDKLAQYLASAESAGFQVGVLTNRRRNATDPILDDLRELFPVEARAGKPGRHGFIRLLTRMNARPEDTVMIGDKVWTDILGANRNGIHSILVKRPPVFSSDEEKK